MRKKRTAIKHRKGLGARNARIMGQAAVDPVIEAERRELVEHYEKEVAALPAKLRKVWLRWRDGATTSEIAARYEVTDRAVRQWLDDARSRLRLYLIAFVSD
jgi:DNA-directed RNA polymerase specialized sigma24 family protein